MAVNRRQSFESGQSSGTTITNVNSAVGGDAADTVTIGTGASVTFDSTAYRGLLSMASSTGASTSVASFNWTTFTTLPRAYGRAVINASSLAVLLDFLRMRAAGAQIFRLRLNTNGKLDFRSATGNSIIATSTTVFTTSAWYLIRWDVTIGASAPGAIYIHTDPTSPTATEILSTNTGSFGTANADEFNIGAAITALANVGTFRCDDVLLTDQGLPGPPIQSVTISDSAAGSDAVTRVLLLPRPVGDTAAGSDSSSRQLLVARSLTDAAAGIDTVARQLLLARSVGDAAAGIDSTARALILPRALTDAAAGVDTTASNTVAARQVTDTAAGTDAPARAVLLPRAVLDAAGGTDTTTGSVVLPRTAADAAAAVDNPSAGVSLARAATDAAAGTDTVSRSARFARATTDSAAGTDSATATGHSSRPLVDVIWSVEEAPGRWQPGEEPGAWTFAEAPAGWQMEATMRTIPVVSTEYVHAKVGPILVDGQAYDPTGDVVQLAFMPGTTEPGDSDWHTGSWENSGVPDIYFARCLVGPAGGVALAAGDYVMWCKVTDNPEVPARQFGTLRVY